MPMDIITPPSLQQAGFQWRAKDGVRVLCCPPLEQDGFAAGFSTRLGGVSAMPHDDLNLAGFDDDTADNIHENRRRFFAALGGDWELAAGWQVHGTEVRLVDEIPDLRCDQAQSDALATCRTGVLLGVKTADCVPVLLGDARTGALAAVHAGWRGTLEGIVGQTLGQMAQAFGTQPADIRAAIGPAALACCYEVGPEVIAAFQERFAYAGTLFTAHRAGHARVDLHQANRQQLTDAGVAPHNIHAAPLCTICRTDLFFSYRREKSLLGTTGRLMSVIGRQ
jgi:YfiH family protein